MRPRSWAVSLVFCLCPLLLCGCKPNKRYDLIEAELRTRERELADTRAALEQARNLNRAYVQQSQTAGSAAGLRARPRLHPGEGDRARPRHRRRR